MNSTRRTTRLRIAARFLMRSLDLRARSFLLALASVVSCLVVCPIYPKKGRKNQGDNRNDPIDGKRGAQSNQAPNSPPSACPTRLPVRKMPPKVAIARPR